MEEQHISIQDTGIWSISESDGIHETPKTSPKLGAPEGNKDICISRRSNHYCQDQRIEPPPHHSGVSKVAGIGFPFQRIQISPHSNTTDRSPRIHNRHNKHVTFNSSIQTPRHPSGSLENVTNQVMQSPKSIIVYRESTSNHSSRLSSQVKNSRTITTEESTTSPRELMEHNDYNYTTSLRELTLVDQPLNQIERSIILTRDTETRSIHRCIEQRMGNYDRQSSDEWNMDSRGIRTTYQLQGTSSDMEVCEDETTSGSGNTHLLRQHISNSLCTPFWGDPITSTHGISNKNLEHLFENQHSLASHIYSVSNQPSRFPITANGHSNRMENRSTILPTVREAMGDTQRRLLCESRESPNSWKWDPQTLSTNEFLTPWNRWKRVFLCPPWNLLPRCLQHFNQHPTTATIVTPNWTSAIWYLLLLSMTKEPPLLVPSNMIHPSRQGDDLFKKNQQWELLAWNINGKDFN